MNTKIKLLVSTIVITSCTLFIAPQVQASLSGLVKNMTFPGSQMINQRPGPEADPYLRHCPSCYDFETELPPGIDLP